MGEPPTENEKSRSAVTNDVKTHLGFLILCVVFAPFAFFVTGFAHWMMACFVWLMESLR